MPCFSTIQWLASDTNGLRIDAAMSAWLYGPRVSPMSWSSAHTTYSSSAVGPVGPRGRLQRVLEAVDGEPAGVALEQPQVGQHAVGQPGGERQVVVGDDAPVELRALRHGVERRPRVPSMSSMVIGPSRERGRDAGRWPSLRCHSMRRTLFEDVHEEFRAAFRSFLDREAVPAPRRAWEAAGIVDRELFRSAGANGFLGMAVPEELRRRRRRRLPLQRRHRRGAAARPASTPPASG